MFFFKFCLSLFLLLLSVAFFTLFERKILGYSHFRLGPNKLFIVGLFQPFSDAVKLFLKDFFKLKYLNFFIFMFSPFYCLLLTILCWGVFYFWGVLFFSKFSFLLIICLFGLWVYFLLLSGWGSNSKFSLLGSYRSSAQAISYEVLLIFSLLYLIYLWFFLDITSTPYFSLVNSFFLFFTIFFCWFLSCLAESNRSPFDFSEGESELVSGFNTEYSGGLFSFIFIGEYSSIIFLSFFSSLLFLSNYYFYYFFFMFCFFYLWARCSFPRLRYDFLMMMAWKGLMFLLFSSYFCFFVML